MKRLLITGASGDLGRPLSALAAQRWETTGTYFSRAYIGGGNAVRLDLRDRSAVLALVRELRPAVIIHAAASDRSEDMVTTNLAAARHLAEAAQTVGCRLIALSTDMVFDGRNPPYREEDPPTPLSPYGEVKAANEQMFQALGGDCLVVRTSLIYDLTPENRQVRWMQEAIASGQRVTLFTDEIRQPIWAWNLAEILLELAESEQRGLLNVAGPQAMSRWEYGCALLRALGYSPDEVAVAVRAADVAPQRPRDLTLCLDRARAILKTPLLPLDEALRLAQGGYSSGHRTSTTTKR